MQFVVAREGRNGAGGSGFGDHLLNNAGLVRLIRRR